MTPFISKTKILAIIFYLKKVTKPKKNQKRAKKNVMVEYASRTTMHGLPNLVSSERFFVKVMWFVVILMGISATTYIIFNCLIDYMNWNVVTTIDVRRENTMVFPAVTLCFREEVWIEYRILKLYLEWFFDCHKKG